VIDDLDVDSPEVGRFLAELRALSDSCDPMPSGELAALVASGLPGPVAPARVPRRPVAGVSAAVLLAALTGTGWAAAANELPRPVQDAIADLSGPLPFNVPHSGERDDPGPVTDWRGLPADQPPRQHRSRTPAPEGDAVEAHDTAPAGAGTGGSEDAVPTPAPVAEESDTNDDGPDEDESQGGAGQPAVGPSDDGDGDAGDENAGDDQAGDPDEGDPTRVGPPGVGPPGVGPPGVGPRGVAPPGGSAVADGGYVAAADVSNDEGGATEAGD
jgi:hypothetical protein